MALGKRAEERQDELWISSQDLPRSPGHPFYQKLNGLLAEAGFDRWIEERCRPCFSELGRPSIPPGVYFRMILVGYFEGIGSQRGIAWRCRDSRSLGEFLGCGETEPTPDHSSMTNMHKRLNQEIHEEVFRFVVGLTAQKGLLKGKTVAVDSTTLEANAAMKSIVRKDNGDDWKEHLTKLANEAGIEDPTDEDLRRLDKKRKGKKVSNKEWESSTDPDSRIAKMKDGRTHLAYKAEHVIDLESGVIVAAQVYTADQADTKTVTESVCEARSHVEEAKGEDVLVEVAADKGYHSDQALQELDEVDVTVYIPEPARPHQRRWTDKEERDRRLVYANRRRTRRAKSKRLQRRRSEVVERSFAHVCDTGGSRRSWLRGLGKVTKRYLIQTAAYNLGLLMRKLFGIGKPRGLQGDSLLAMLLQLLRQLLQHVSEALGGALRESERTVYNENQQWALTA